MCSFLMLANKKMRHDETNSFQTLVGGFSVDDPYLFFLFHLFCIFSSGRYIRKMIRIAAIKHASISGTCVICTMLLCMAIPPHLY
jgi:hypothetical protein